MTKFGFVTLPSEECHDIVDRNPNGTSQDQMLGARIFLKDEVFKTR